MAPSTLLTVIARLNSSYANPKIVGWHPCPRQYEERADRQVVWLVRECFNIRATPIRAQTLMDLAEMMPVPLILKAKSKDAYGDEQIVSLRYLAGRSEQLRKCPILRAAAAGAIGDVDSSELDLKGYTAIVGIDMPISSIVSHLAGRSVFDHRIAITSDRRINVSVGKAEPIHQKVPGDYFPQQVTINVPRVLSRDARRGRVQESGHGIKHLPDQ